MLPSFITAPPRVPSATDLEGPRFNGAQQNEGNGDFPVAAEPVAQPSFDAPDQGERNAIRGRRRRPRPQFGFDAPEKNAADEQPLVREESGSAVED